MFCKSKIIIRYIIIILLNSYKSVGYKIRSMFHNNCTFLCGNQQGSQCSLMNFCSRCCRIYAKLHKAFTCTKIEIEFHEWKSTYDIEIL